MAFCDMHCSMPNLAKAELGLVYSVLSKLRQCFDPNCEPDNRLCKSCVSYWVHIMHLVCLELRNIASIDFALLRCVPANVVAVPMLHPYSAASPELPYQPMATTAFRPRKHMLDDSRTSWSPLVQLSCSAAPAACSLMSGFC